MTILFFSRLFYPHIGGVEKHIFEIGQRLIKKDHRVIVISEKTSDRLDRTMKKKLDQFSLYYIPVGSNEWMKKFTIWYWLWRHRFLIQSTDIIHCHDVFFWYLPFRFFYFNKPVYTTFHGYETYPIQKRAIITRKLAEFLSWGTICVGDFMKKWYFAKPTFVTYGGVDTQKLKIKKLPTGRQGEKVKKNNKSAVFIGRLDQQTGITTYVEAVKLIRKKIPQFKFVIIGNGKLRPKVEKGIEVLDWIQEPYEYLSKSHFAFVSRYLSILEAMAAKKLVFAVYDNPLKKDYLQQTPFSQYISISGSVEELVDHATYFLTHPEDEKKLLERGYECVKNNTWDAVVKSYIKLWFYNR